MAVPVDPLTPAPGDALIGGFNFLEGHTSPSDGTTWARHPLSDQGPVLGADGAHGPGVPSFCLYTASPGPASPAQSLAVTLRASDPFGVPGLGGGQALYGLALRVSATARTLYAGGYREDYAGARGFWEVWRFAAGARTTLASVAAPLYADATGRAFRLSCAPGGDGGVALTLTVGGRLVASASDPSPTSDLLATGGWGLYMEGAGLPGYALSALDIVPQRRSVCG